MQQNSVHSLKPRLAAALLAAAFALSAGGVATAASPPPPRPDAPVSSQSTPASRPVMTDDAWTEAEARLPGFGGIFLKDNILHVYLLEPVDSAELEPVIAEIYGAAVIPSGGIKVLQGQYAISQLRAWQQTDLANLPGVVTIGVGEMQNRLIIGLASEDAKAGVKAELQRLGVPEAAVILEVVGEIQLLATGAAGREVTTMAPASAEATTMDITSGASAPGRLLTILGAGAAAIAVPLLFVMRRRTAR